MSIYLTHLKEYIIQPTLHTLNMYSKSAEILMIGTCAVESELGFYLHQLKGPALGIYQMEPSTYLDICRWLNSTKKHGALVFKLSTEFNFRMTFVPPPTILLYDLRIATVFARLKYWMIKERLPESNRLELIAKYWKKHYNTPKGKGKWQDFISRYEYYEHEANG